MQRIADLAQQLGPQGMIDVEDSPELVEELMDGTEAEKPIKSKVKVQAFRHAGSPGKVAANHLKQKSDK